MGNEELITNLADVVLKLINIQIDRRNRALIADKDIGVDLTAYYGTIGVDPFLPMEDLLYHGTWRDVLAAAESLQQFSSDFRDFFTIERTERHCLHIQVRPGIKLTKSIRMDTENHDQRSLVTTVDLERKL